MQYLANTILASKNEANQKVITLHCCYPRIIHAEAKTHRIMSTGQDGIEVLMQDIGLNSDRNLSRNAGSSRAIPTARMLANVRMAPAMPASWGKNQKGMQAEEDCTEPIRVPHYLRQHALHLFPDQEIREGELFLDAPTFWHLCAMVNADLSELFAEAGYHKQVTNRLTEPYQWMNTVISVTDPYMDGFLELRDHKDADPTFQVLAKMIRKAWEEADFKLLLAGQWHIPYILPEEEGLDLLTKLKLSTARCARVSYSPFDGDASHEAEFRRHDLLVGSKPWHASPTEHPCTPHIGQHGNFNGWMQYRQFIEQGLAIE